MAYSWDILADGSRILLGESTLGTPSPLLEGYDYYEPTRSRSWFETWVIDPFPVVFEAAAWAAAATIAAPALAVALPAIGLTGGGGALAGYAATAVSGAKWVNDNFVQPVNDAVVQPVGGAIADAGGAINHAVVQPVGGAVADAWDAVTPDGGGDGFSLSLNAPEGLGAFVAAAYGAIEYTPYVWHGTAAADSPVTTPAPPPWMPTAAQEEDAQPSPAVPTWLYALAGLGAVVLIIKK